MNRALCLFSGGKDSVFATWWALFQGFNVILLTIQSEKDSMMFHHPNVKWTKMQAQSANLPHLIVNTTNENEFDDLKNAISKHNVDAIVSGAIASEYQKQCIEQIGENLGIATYAPLWHKENALMNELLKYFEIYVVAVSAQGLGKELLTKPFSEFTRKKIKDIHLFFEGGEGETFVAHAPFFEKRIIIREWNISWDGVRGVAEIKNAHLE